MIVSDCILHSLLIKWKDCLEITPKENVDKVRNQIAEWNWRWVTPEWCWRETPGVLPQGTASWHIELLCLKCDLRTLYCWCYSIFSLVIMLINSHLNYWNCQHNSAMNYNYVNCCYCEWIACKIERSCYHQYLCCYSPNSTLFTANLGILLKLIKFGDCWET